MSRFKEFLNEGKDAQEELLMILLEGYLEKFNSASEGQRAELSRFAFVNNKLCFDAKLKMSKTEATLYSFEIEMVKKH